MKKIYLTIFSLVILLYSCSNFLDEVPYNKITVGNFYKTAEGVEHGINGLYAKLKDIYGHHEWIYLCEAPTDIFRDATGMDAEFKTWTLDATSNNINSFWSKCYTTINQANSVIDALENNELPGLNEIVHKQYLAEAKFIRANMYYHLVQQFGDIPLKTKPTATVETEAIRTESDQIWELIIEDLEFGVNNLPTSYPAAQYGRITKYAAMHHLGRVYLTVKRDNNDINRAKNLTESIITEGSFQLVSSHEKLWNIGNQINSEVIFPIVFVKNPELNGNGNQMHVFFNAGYSDFYQTAIARDLTYGRPWSRARPTWFLEGLYNEDIDQRWDDCFRSSWLVNRTIATDNVFSPITKKVEQITWNMGDLVYIIPKTLWTKEQIAQAWPTWVWLPDTMRNHIPESNIQSASNPDAEWPINTKFQIGTMYHTLIKHLDPERVSVNAMDGSRDVFVFRLADTYLLAAEACFLLGDNVKAAEYINVIRKRAAKPDKENEMNIEASDINIDFILDERARELSGEMHRWYDLKRTGKLLERMTNPNMNESVAESFKEYHVLRPIPRDQLTRISNPENFHQNPGYGN